MSLYSAAILVTVMKGYVRNRYTSKVAIYYNEVNNTNLQNSKTEDCMSITFKNKSEKNWIWQQQDIKLYSKLKL